MLRCLSIAAACGALLVGSAQATVPLHPAATVHLMLPAFVNGKGPFQFLLDTGADETGLYQWFVEQQGLKPGKIQDVEGMTGTVSTPVYHLDSVSVDGREIRNLDADSFPNRHDVEVEAGAVGNDLMNGAVVVYDFPCRTVSILPKPVDLKHVLTAQAHRIDGGPVVDGTQLTLPVWVGKVQGIAVLDTGSSDTRINTAFARAAGIDPASAAFRDAEPIFGVNSNPVPSRKGPVGAVRFAGLEARNTELRVIDLPVFRSFGFGDGPAMILGLDLMQGHRLVYDHEAKRFWFDASTCR